MDRDEELRIIILRNRLELSSVEVSISENWTLSQLLEKTVKTLEGYPAEQSHRFNYRFRRVAYRKNQTRRPMNFYKPADYDKKLKDLGFKIGRIHIYLEQDVDSRFPGLDESKIVNGIFISLRLWNHSKGKPISLRDMSLSDFTTVNQLKYLLSSLYPSLDPSNLLIVEEEKEDIFNLLLHESSSLVEYSISNGDVLHIEQLFENSVRNQSLTEDYFKKKAPILEVPPNEEVNIMTLYAYNPKSLYDLCVEKVCNSMNDVVVQVFGVPSAVNEKIIEYFKQHKCQKEHSIMRDWRVVNAINQLKNKVHQLKSENRELQRTVADMNKRLLMLEHQLGVSNQM